MSNLKRMINEINLKKMGVKLGIILAGLNITAFVFLQAIKIEPNWMYSSSVILVIAGLLLLKTRPRY